MFLTLLFQRTSSFLQNEKKNAYIFFWLIKSLYVGSLTNCKPSQEKFKNKLTQKKCIKVRCKIKKKITQFDKEGGAVQMKSF